MNRQLWIAVGATALIATACGADTTSTEGSALPPSQEAPELEPTTNETATIDALRGGATRASCGDEVSFTPAIEFLTTNLEGWISISEVEFDLAKAEGGFVPGELVDVAGERIIVETYEQLAADLRLASSNPSLQLHVAFNSQGRSEPALDTAVAIGPQQFTFLGDDCTTYLQNSGIESEPVADATELLLSIIEGRYEPPKAPELPPSNPNVLPQYIPGLTDDSTMPMPDPTARTVHVRSLNVEPIDATREPAEEAVVCAVIDGLAGECTTLGDFFRLEGTDLTAWGDPSSPMTLLLFPTDALDSSTARTIVDIARDDFEQAAGIGVTLTDTLGIDATPAAEPIIDLCREPIDTSARDAWNWCPKPI